MLIGGRTAQAGVFTDYQIFQTPYLSITSPTPDEYVSTGNLTISGISSDNATSDCAVYVGWNGSSPYQPASANGTGGLNDYSTWNYTYTPTYHEIINGTNELDSLLYCAKANPTRSFDSFVQPVNITHSINVTGINSNLSNFTGTEYYYQDNSSRGYYDPGTTLTSGGEGLNYDSSGITYNSGDSGLDSSGISSGTSSISSGDYNYDDYYNYGSAGSSSGSSSDNNDDDDDNTNDDSSGETDSGSLVVPSPVAADGVFDIGAAGDWGSESDAGKTALNMHQQGVDLAIGLGDYSYQEGADNVKKWWNSQMVPLHGLFKGALGNHDTKDQATYAQLFAQPGEWHYSFDKNHVHFVAIDTESGYGPTSSQYKYIDQDLQAASKNTDVDWIVVFLHEPMYTSPSHHDALASLRDTYHPLFDKYGVDLVLQGHNHNYQRSFPMMYNTQDPTKPIVFADNNNGVFTDPPGQIYTEVGTAGKSKYSLEGKSSFIAEQFDTNVGFLNVAFPDDKTMNAAFYDNSGNIKDKFTIKKTGSSKPIGVNDIAKTEEDTPVTIQVLTNDKNQYGLATAPVLPNPNLQVQVEVVGTRPLHGTVNTGNNGNGSSNNNENEITYTPTHDYFGTDSFTYRIAPATGIGPASPPTKVSVNVEPVNDPPVANNDNATYDQGSSGGTINVIANDVDPDGDPLKVTEISDTSDTALSNQSRIINNLDGTITYTPASRFAGVDSFSYTITDGSNATASATVQVTVIPTNSSTAPLPANSNITNGNITNGNVNSTNSNVTSFNSTLLISNSTYTPQIQANNANNNGTLDQFDTDVVSNSSLLSEKQNLPGVNVTENSNESLNNTSSVPDANTVLNAAIENLNNNRLSGLPFQNQTSSILNGQNGNDISSSNGAIAKLDGLYDQTTANEMARATALEAEHSLQSRNNEALVDSSLTEPDSNSQNVTTNDQIRTTSNSVVEESQSSTLSVAKQPTADSTIGSDISNSQTKQELERQVQDELARAQASMQDKDENSVNEAQHSSNTELDSSENPKSSTNSDESSTKSDTDNNSENSRSQQAKNTKPIAQANSRSQGVKEGSKVVLDGSGSNDKDGDKLSYLWRQVEGPRVKISHDNDAVASFEAPSVPGGNGQSKLQFVFVVSDGKDTDKDTISVSLRQDPSQDNNNNNNINNDEKARKSTDDHKSASDDGDGKRGSDSTDSSSKSDDKNNDKNVSQNDSEKSDDKNKSQDDNGDAPKENPEKSNDNEEIKDNNEQSNNNESESKSDSS